ncbi:MAG: LD-carboxypeptidase [Maribacter sp.]
MQSRRHFFNGIFGLSLSTLFPIPSFSNTPHQKRILPKALKKGDTIGLIAPGYMFPSRVLNETLETLKKMEYKPYYTPRIYKGHGYFSNTDEERAKDLNHMFANPLVDGILCLRGGYGCTRIMNSVNYEMIKENPKALIGFSDITALLNGIYKETGLVGFHGPVGSTLNNDYSITSFQRMLQGAVGYEIIKNAESNLPQEEYERYTITKGKGSGELCGGNLTLINALIGTAHEIDFTNKLVCIEDVEEDPYRIDRMLTQLIEGKSFKNAAGIIIGVCAGCNESTNPNSFSLKEVILDRIKPLDIPSAYGMSFGHIKNNFTFPVGINAEFDAEEMSIRLLEKPVI